MMAILVDSANSGFITVITMVLMIGLMIDNRQHLENGKSLTDVRRPNGGSVAGFDDQAIRCGDVHVAGYLGILFFARNDFA